MSLDIVYTAVAHASGGGRDGHVRSEDDRLDIDTRPPKEMGGSGEGTNPEQLFAAGYAACFLGALHAAGRELSLDTTGAEVSAEVGIGGTGTGEFGLAVELDVYTPAVEQSQRQRVAERAHEICPYSNATRGNITVTLSLVD
jgi:osmotically inducible protein OsmC